MIFKYFEELGQLIVICFTLVIAAAMLFATVYTVLRMYQILFG